jgi:hypothetical protein
MRVSLIGPGNVNFHFHELLKISQEDMNKNIYGISETLAKSKSEIVILPDKGIAFEIAKKYKELGGKKVVGAVPKADVDFGTGQLRPYIETRIEGRRLIDEIINSGTWYEHDSTLALFGDCILLLGKSLGSMGELNMGFYIYKLLSKKTESPPKANRLQSQIRAGRKIPFTLIVYLPFAKDRLDYETECYIKKAGGRIAYAKSAEDFQKILGVLEKEYFLKKR